ncbi:type II secretion system protein [Halapricum sp. CBA1109]|uniref:type II/IV secretion system ATPase subunit n=1 Tax=Halapricum sp. CBA1109 TaxID=2668068 RepID=UPI0012FA230E|nr:type II/IV secretion system ATPase subunit [Halapricum sp. CBA1109]MUV88765.1 type II secretion system protein [Halapricum sp. CBA1109]
MADSGWSDGQVEPETAWEDRIDDGGPADSESDAQIGEEDPVVLTDDGSDLPPPEESVIEDVVAYFDDHESEFATTPDRSFLESDFFDFDYREGVREVERYWVNEPYAYVAVLYDEDTDDHRYHAVEPTLSEYERYVREDIMADLRDVLMHVDPDTDTRERLTSELKTLMGRYAHDAPAGSLYKIRYYIQRDLLGYDRIDPMVRDRRLEDISCDGVDVPVYVYHRDYRDMETGVAFGEQRLNSLVVRLAQRSDKHISVADPMVDASLPNGSRVQLTLGREVSTRGSNFTIRQFSDVPLTPIDLIQWGTFSVETMTYLWLAIENNLSLLFAGGTASGKTTSMNAVSMFIPRKNKIISIEDTREITLPHDNWIQSVTREGRTADSGTVSMYDLLQAALRQRPEYLLVGEIRTEQQVALAFFQAMATGHAAYTTMHADSPETVLSRLENEPLNVPRQMIRELDIVAIQRQIFVGDKRVRRNTELVEIDRAEGGGVDTNQVYEWSPDTDSIQATNRSRQLREIMYMNGWGPERLEDELRQRERLLRYLVEHDISDYESFRRLVWQYASDSRKVMAALDDDDVDRLLDT